MANTKASNSLRYVGALLDTRCRQYDNRHAPLRSLSVGHHLDHTAAHGAPQPNTKSSRASRLNLGHLNRDRAGRQRCRPSDAIYKPRPKLPRLRCVPPPPML